MPFRGLWNLHATYCWHNLHSLGSWQSIFASLSLFLCIVCLKSNSNTANLLAYADWLLNYNFRQSSKQKANANRTEQNTSLPLDFAPHSAISYKTFLIYGRLISFETFCQYLHCLWYWKRLSENTSTYVHSRVQILTYVGRAARWSHIWCNWKAAEPCPASVRQLVTRSSENIVNIWKNVSQVITNSWYEVYIVAEGR